MIELFPTHPSMLSLDLLTIAAICAAAICYLAFVVYRQFKKKGCGNNCGCSPKFKKK